MHVLSDLLHNLPTYLLSYIWWGLYLLCADICCHNFTASVLPAVTRQHVMTDHAH